MKWETKHHGQNHHELKLAHGALHVFAGDELFAALDEKVYEMADNNLRIPRNT